MLDTIPTSSMDESVALVPSAQQDLFQKVDGLISTSLKQRDPLLALNGVSSLTGLERLVGLGKAKLLWSLESNWDLFQIEEDFHDFVTEHTSISRETVDRYILTWDMYEEHRVPERLVPAIMGRTMRDQVEIAKIADRVELTAGDWKEIAATTNGHELTEVKRKLTGQKPRKSGLILRLRRNGDIEAYDSDKKKHFVGFLERGKAKDDPIIQRAIERLTRSTGMLVE